jgi:hypothetical protein
MNRADRSNIMLLERESRGSAPMFNSRFPGRFLSDLFGLALPDTPEGKQFHRQIT